MGVGSDATVVENKSVGFNLVWDVSEQLVLELDHHNSMATKQPGSVFGDSSQLAISAFSRDKTTTYFGGQLRFCLWICQIHVTRRYDRYR